MTRKRSLLTLSLAFGAVIGAAAPAVAQAVPADAYLDPTARELVERARAARGRQGADVESYTAVVLRRSAARLRAPLRDRLLGRSETAMRVRWSRTGPIVVQRLASRTEDIGEAAHPESGVPMDAIFDPDADRIQLSGVGMELLVGRTTTPEDSAARGLGVRLGVGVSPSDSAAAGRPQEDAEDDNFWIAHPLADGSEAFYRYRGGDTLTLRLGEGRTVRAVELIAIPRRGSFHHLRASLWIEPESGAVVRALYRPARDLDVERDTVFVDEDDLRDMRRIPGMFRPIGVDLGLMTVEYGLWNGRHWLPRRMGLTGHIRFGVVRIPFESEVAYRIEEVEDVRAEEPTTPRALLASWGAPASMVESIQVDDGDTIVVFTPEDERELLHGDLLPPPVWRDAPAFASAEEIDAFARRLDDAVPAWSLAAPPHFELQWLLDGRGLVRYNRVEALSLGLRGALDHPRGRGLATVRMGAADLHPNVELAALVPRRALAFRIEAYHRLATVEPGLPAFEAPQTELGFGNAFNALFFGRDDGQYYRATGGFVALEPRPEARPSWRVALYGERHHAARRKVEWNVATLVSDDRAFRPNLRADEVDLAGALLHLAPWWGVGAGLQGGLDALAEAAGGDSTFARLRLIGRGAVPLPGGFRLGLEAGGGHAWGGPPVQRFWFLGGPTTLRAYDGGVQAGPSMGRARVELGSNESVAGLRIWSDAAWAGRRDAFEAEDVLYSAGVGFSVIDGLVRFDVGRALAAPTGWRLHVYLDALM